MREYPSQHALRPIMLIINPIMHLWHETETRLVARGVVGEWDRAMFHLQNGAINSPLCSEDIEHSG